MASLRLGAAERRLRVPFQTFTGASATARHFGDARLRFSDAQVATRHTV